jgi:tRNA (cytidine/uridine-2'-O-)-methyltransferase
MLVSLHAYRGKSPEGKARNREIQGKIQAMRLVLFEPDIPQNTGALLRLGACLGIAVDIVEPCGFLFDDKRLRRAGMDYLEAVEMVRHRSWDAYRAAARNAAPGHPPGRPPGRLVLLTTRGETRYTDFAFEPGDNLLLGRESAGVPEAVHAQADARLLIPMGTGIRSLNVALAAAMVSGEALRQTGLFPQTDIIPESPA